MNKFLQIAVSLFFCFTVSTVNAQNWQLVWQDEFLGTQIDPSKWQHEVNGTGGGNNELQYYTARDTNSFVENGALVIQALKETYTGPDGTRDYTSARLRTKNRGDWKYGRIEVRAKIPAGVGTWPAIWMLPTDWVYGGWPNSGEIDIMEHVGFDPGVIHGTVHTKAFNHTNGTQQGSQTFVGDFDVNYHVYALEWTPSQIRVYVDNNHYFTFNNLNEGWEKWPFDQRFHLILNIAIGGTWGGLQGVDDSIFPVRMYIDYVRVYQDADAAPNITLLQPVAGGHFNPGDPIELSVDASDPNGSIAKVEFFQGEGKIGQVNSPPYEWTIDNAYEGCYELSAVATDNDGYTSQTLPIQITVGNNCGKSPYLIAPHAIPGIIEMEYFDLGGDGLGYSDSDVQNRGNKFRTGESVDIEIASDIGGGFNLGWIEAGEWVEYLVDIRYAGVYSIISRVAAPNSGGAFQITIDDSVVTPVINVDATGGWQVWQSIFTDNVVLPRGVHRMRVKFLNGGFNINKLTVFALSVGTESTPSPAVPTKFELHQNYPNPFNPGTTIAYSLNRGGGARIDLFNILGQHIATLHDGFQTAGEHKFYFDGSDLQSGTYFVKLQAGEQVRIKKMTLLK